MPQQISSLWHKRQDREHFKQIIGQNVELQIAQVMDSLCLYANCQINKYVTLMDGGNPPKYIKIHIELHTFLLKGSCH